MSNPNRQPHPQVMAVPPPEIITKQHIDNCLDIVGALHPYLFPPPQSPESSVPKDAQRLEGEALLAATSTFIKACSRLDNLLEDATRWTLDPHKKLYDLLNANYAQQFEFLKSQTQASNSLSRPFFLLKPDLVQTTDGEFVAYIGDVTTPGAGLLGRGKTPNEAYADFDAAFFRAEQHRLENSDPEPKPKRKKK